MEFNLNYFILEMITFVIGLTLSAFIYLPYLKGWMAKRRDRIESQLAEAEKRHQEAEKLKTDFEARSRDLEAKVGAALKEAQVEAQKTREEIVLSARKEAEKIMYDAHAMIDAEKKSAVKEIQKEMGSMAVAIAEKIVRGSVDAKAQERIVAEGLKEMGSRKN